MSNLNLQKLHEWVWPWPWTFKSAYFVFLSFLFCMLQTET